MLCVMLRVTLLRRIWVLYYGLFSLFVAGCFGLELLTWFWFDALLCVTFIVIVPFF